MRHVRVPLTTRWRQGGDRPQDRDRVRKDSAKARGDTPGVSPMFRSTAQDSNRTPYPRSNWALRTTAATTSRCSSWFTRPTCTALKPRLLRQCSRPSRPQPVPRLRGTRRCCVMRSWPGSASARTSPSTKPIYCPCRLPNYATSPTIERQDQATNARDRRQSPLHVLDRWTGLLSIMMPFDS